jgi:uncharacterized membrane protein
LTSNKPEKFKQEVIQSVKAELYAGPLPHPDILEKFEKVVPGSADRIIKQAERQTEHRISIESKVIQSDITNSRIGLIFGFILGLVGVLGGIYLTINGFSVFGPLLSGGTLVALVSVFIYGTATRRTERLERRRKQITN